MSSALVDSLKYYEILVESIKYFFLHSYRDTIFFAQHSHNGNTHAQKQQYKAT